MKKAEDMGLRTYKNFIRTLLVELRESGFELLCCLSVFLRALFFLVTSPVLYPIVFLIGIIAYKEPSVDHKDDI